MSADEQGVVSVWARPARKRRERLALDRGQIVAAAVALLDEQGLPALTMRGLATRMNVAANALYWHVANKDELIELVVDEIYGEMSPPVADDPARWGEAVSRCGHSARDVVLRHPWVASLLVGEVGVTHLGPNLMLLTDRMLTLLRAAGFDLAEADRAAKTVFTYVLGAATSEAAALNKITLAGDTEAEWLDALGPTLTQITGPYPQLATLFDSLTGTDPRTTRDDQFDYGLRRLLDGLHVRLRQVTEQRP
ncbi:TetR/AcrR family transcriptional regulator [Actinomadura sp. NEAU-AAG7]|uniref:TetR/AcrR family transcriptional regulator n=1 Tax=Actinomadura sp. NEAU-AAG7 TaxID=2839640 RepID=UPI001BE44946|nr:TetR/AcrR family transcriptional regulator [Actinomadura sp. NEAU-AAG7]MBT2212552.1 TetR/AcrR family transcriptional regulator C-terminal domain-containing protein [Actinomadura sp. NEAU-AAG7]